MIKGVFFSDAYAKKAQNSPYEQMAKTIFMDTPSFYMPHNGRAALYGKDLFDAQISHLSSAVLIQDYDAMTIVDSYDLNTNGSIMPPKLTFPKGALISGSFVMALIDHCQAAAHDELIKFDDCDIYFQSKDDAKQFIRENNFTHFNVDSPMCAYGYFNGLKFNLIYGVPYNTPSDLISRFDIRACSVAVSPDTMRLHVVDGAIRDIGGRQLVFNAVPRGCSLRRYAKYIKKGFAVDPYQNLFFTELLKTDIYKPELELLTKNY